MLPHECYSYCFCAGVDGAERVGATANGGGSRSLLQLVPGPHTGTSVAGTGTPRTGHRITTERVQVPRAPGGSRTRRDPHLQLESRLLPLPRGALADWSAEPAARPVAGARGGRTARAVPRCGGRRSGPGG